MTGTIVIEMVVTQLVVLALLVWNFRLRRGLKQTDAVVMILVKREAKKLASEFLSDLIEEKENNGTIKTRNDKDKHKDKTRPA